VVVQRSVADSKGEIVFSAPFSYACNLMENGFVQLTILVIPIYNSVSPQRRVDKITHVVGRLFFFSLP